MTYEHEDHLPEDDQPEDDQPIDVPEPDPDFPRPPGEDNDAKTRKYKCEDGHVTYTDRELSQCACGKPVSAA
jgi:hypothetical protein